MDLNLALLNDKPTAFTDKSSEDEKSFHESWEHSNRLSLMFMRMTVANNIKSTFPQTESARKYLKFVGEHFRSADKSLTGTLIAKLTTMKFDGSRSMQNHIIEMTNISARLRTLGMKVDDTFLAKWDVSELSSMLTQEESRLKKQGDHFINLMGQRAGKGLKVKANKFKKKKAPGKVPQDAHKELKAFTTIQTTNPNKDFLFMGNCMKDQIEGIGTYRLIVETGHHLDLLQTLYVPSIETR
ncbi:hypothetical protein KY284_026406 [Solanum tuberosum]|nr:hypothetical protein KY284_026406 [Solanum tuberosum]